MHELSSLSAVPVTAAVIRRTGEGGWVYDTSGQPVSRRGLSDLLARMKSDAMAAAEVETERLDDSMVLVRPLGTSEGTASTALMLEFSIRDALAEYDFLKLAVLIAGALGLALVAYASARLARHIVRPISALEQARASLAMGRWTSVPVTSDDEIGRWQELQRDVGGNRPARRAHPPHGLSRRADRSPQPAAAARTARAAARGDRARRRRAGGAVPRPRQLQDHQRHPRPAGRRQAAQDGRRAPRRSAARPLPRTHRRRRVLRRCGTARRCAAARRPRR
jgi:HAMP domain-containing protein